ncbi:hypothetical protein COO60DRAFT_647542 [Scenedesmus sp. NREL 46B-D3]|nr:hypothetical protein COO60DRAFT_647542 [Scenedesmus sp. NREL 46B-D3]
MCVRGLAVWSVRSSVSSAMPASFDFANLGRGLLHALGKDMKMQQQQQQHGAATHGLLVCPVRSTALGLAPLELTAHVYYTGPICGFRLVAHRLGWFCTAAFCVRPFVDRRCHISCVTSVVDVMSQRCEQLTQLHHHTVRITTYNATMALMLWLEWVI